MPRYYCDYCDTYLTHDSPSVRKQHNAGYKHKANVRTYYQQFEEQQTQSLIDQRIKEHLSGQAAFGIGASYAAWRPGVRPPMLPLPIPGQVPPNIAMAPVPRLPVFPRPLGVPVYGTAPIPMPGAGNPGAPATPVQPNGLPGPPPMTAPTLAPVTTGSNGALPGPPQSSYHGAPTGGSFSGASMPAPPSFPSSGGTPSEVPDNFTYAQAPDNNH